MEDFAGFGGNLVDTEGEETQLVELEGMGLVRM